MQYRSTRLTNGHTRAWDGFVALDLGLVGFAVDFVVGFAVDVVGFAVDVVVGFLVGFVVNVSRPVVLVPRTCEVTTLPLMG